MNSYSDFIKGTFNGLSLSREGRLSLGPKIDTLFTSDQPVIWSVAQAADGTLYAATGHRGRVYKVDKAGKSSLLWTAREPEIFAIAVDRSGAVYAGTSPDGKVYRIENGNRHRIFRSQSANTSGRWRVGPRRRALRGHRRPGQDLSCRPPPAKARSGMKPASPTSPAWPSTPRIACSPAPSPTEFSTASPPRTRPSSSTTPVCPRFAPSSP